MGGLGVVGGVGPRTAARTFPRATAALNRAPIVVTGSGSTRPSSAPIALVHAPQIAAVPFRKTHRSSWFPQNEQSDAATLRV